MSTVITLPTWGLMLMLGMRHGLDPDHLAAIDGLTFRTASKRPRWAPWIGGLFALGHGIVVMLIIFLASLASEELKFAEGMLTWFQWVPVVLLLILGTANAIALMRSSAYRPVGCRSMLLPHRLREAAGPMHAIMVGMMFALVFDTATQAATWGYAASALDGIATGLLTGLFFSSGMIVTDLFDGWVTSRVMQTGREDVLIAFRRRLGWPIVVMCFSVAGYAIAVKLHPALEIPENWYSICGGAMLILMMALYGYTLHSVCRQKAKHMHVTKSF
ncbi:MAG TPA: hypothetical protein VIF82_03915 [Burkholderiaceae bacterium]|jgi:high-affinity nickel-transport protein